MVPDQSLGRVGHGIHGAAHQKPDLPQNRVGGQGGLAEPSDDRQHEELGEDEAARPAQQVQVGG